VSLLLLSPAVVLLLSFATVFCCYCKGVMELYEDEREIMLLLAAVVV
jgi:hypothetical protein